MLATILRSLAGWAAANPNLAIGAAITLLTFAGNGLAKWGHYAGAVGLIGKVVDFLSVFTRRNADGTFKLPFTFSRLGEQAATIGSAGTSVPPSGKVAAIVVLALAGSAQASVSANLVHAPDAPAITSPAPTASASPAFVLLPVTLPDAGVISSSTDPVAVRLAALEASLLAAQKASGAPTSIPPSFWETKAGQVLGVSLTVATILVSSVASGVSVYEALK